MKAYNVIAEQYERQELAALATKATEENKTLRRERDDAVKANDRWHAHVQTLEQAAVKQQARINELEKRLGDVVLENGRLSKRNLLVEAENHWFRGHPKPVEAVVFVGDRSKPAAVSLDVIDEVTRLKKRTEIYKRRSEHYQRVVIANESREKLKDLELQELRTKLGEVRNKLVARECEIVNLSATLNEQKRLRECSGRVYHNVASLQDEPDSDQYYGKNASIFWYNTHQALPPIGCRVLVAGGIGYIDGALDWHTAMEPGHPRIEWDVKFWAYIPNQPFKP